MWQGRYSDGQSPAVMAVTIVQIGEGFEIRGEDRRTVARWPFVGLQHQYSAANGNRIDFSHADDSDARLMIDGIGVVEQLKLIVPNAIKEEGWGPGLRIAGWLAGGAFIVVGALFLLAETIVSNFPLSWERELGEQLATSDLWSTFDAPGLCSSPTGDAALDKMVARITENYKTLHPLNVRVVDSDINNAFALPGGQIRIFKGLIDKAGSAETVAGVLAHEIGHVEGRHSIRSLARSLLIVAGVETITGGTGISAFLVDLTNLSFSRDMEREADDFAIERMLATDQDPEALSAFFEVLQKEHGEGSLIESVYSTHPLNQERIDKLEAAPTPYRVEPVLSDSEWQALKAICG